MDRQLREADTYAWCPTCQGPQPCERQQGTTDWQTTPVHTCRVCGQVTHDPVLRLIPAGQPAVTTKA
jgi:hypothetical protein